MITLLSPTQQYRATVSDHDDGAFVAIRSASGGPTSPGTQLWHGVIDAPFHIVADRVLDILANLEEGQ